MEWLKEAMDYFLDKTEQKIFKIDNREYTSERLMPIQDPTPTPLAINTLTGIENWLEIEEHDDLIMNDSIMIHVNSYKNVRILSWLQENWQDRHFFLDVTFEKEEEFQFNWYMDIEKFIIEARCHFEPTPELNSIINYVSNIRDEKVSTAKDDGIAQEVITENRIGRLEKTTINPIMPLKPYRTFLEIEQPTSLFLLRLKKVEKSLPEAALFKCDPGLWKLEAIERIKNYILDFDYVKKHNIPVIA
jgi:hypothetical protein